MHWWHILVLFGVLVGPHIVAALIRRAKRGSDRWQHRSERQQRFLALLPGAVVMLAAVIALDIFDVPW